jgi:hypothetical protein
MNLWKVNWRFRGIYHLTLFATCFRAGILLSFFFNPEAGGDMFLQNVGWLSMATWSYILEDGEVKT